MVIGMNYEVIPVIIGAVVGGGLWMIAYYTYFFRTEKEGSRPKLLFPKYDSQEMKIQNWGIVAIVVGIALTFIIKWLKHSV
ncbi:MAG: hypothetical protein HZA22_12395 [Nitrospirae bacterium]|nr:hypothetical protein [Nitrospirota bacterium]